MNWVSQFAGLAQLDPSLQKTLIDSSEVVSFDKRSIIFGAGKAPEHLVLLLEGSIQVQQASENGREIVLYRVAAGNSCVLTAACVLAFKGNTAKAIAETGIKAVLIPRNVFDELLDESREFRYFVLSAFTKRMTDLFQVIEEVAFKRIDHRLAQKLVELCQGGSVVQATHQSLANELGSVREVVSRQLLEFQNRGWVQQHRGMVEIVNRPELQKLIDQ